VYKRNIKLIIEYDGAGFNGWQTQRVTSHRFQVAGKRLKTVQGEIEKAAKKLFRKKISLIGASRTDSGVHARAQVANFRIDSNLGLDNIKNGLNSLLPRCISIISAEEVSLKFHSGFDSIEKLYKYTIVNGKSRSPLLERYAAFVPYDLNIIAMKKAARYLIGRKDFKSFQASDKKYKSSIRSIKKIEIIERPESFSASHPEEHIRFAHCKLRDEGSRIIEIYIKADGFLYNMARNIVGTLIEVGRGRFKPEKVKEILEGRHRALAGQTAPAKGLCLEKVFYTSTAPKPRPRGLG
jgi:tRNA pseudouridine38-40 synthase